MKLKHFLAIFLTLTVGTFALGANRQWEAQEFIYGQIATPSAPSSGKMKLYGKSNGGLYKLLSSGSEVKFQELDAAVTGLLTQTGSTTVVGRTITGTANQVIVINGSGSAGNPTLSTPQDIAITSEPTFSDATLSGVTANRALTTNGSSAIKPSVTTAAELAFLSGATSNIQTQINNLISGGSSAIVVRAYSVSTTVSDSADTLVTLVFATESVDTNSAYNNATGVFTCPATGNYFVSAQALVDDNGVSIGVPAYLAIKKNGTAVSYGNHVAHSTSTSAFLSPIVTDVIPCNATDTLEVAEALGQATAGNAILNGTPEQNHLSIYFIR